jgi:uncharacterized protein (TIGR00290 family)
MSLKRVLLSWSSGKDSAWALHRLRQRDDCEVVALVTTFNEAFGRVAMHSVRRELVRMQAELAGLPLWEIPLPWPCSNEQYEAQMKGVCGRAVTEEIEQVAFGDLYLRDIRAYREKQLAGTGLEPIFPVWDIPTRELAGEMLAAGVKAKLTCVDPKQLDVSFAGRDFDEALLRDLPEWVDSCGENGEFHTFCYASPVFREAIAVEAGEVVVRDGFCFADLLPVVEKTVEP